MIDPDEYEAEQRRLAQLFYDAIDRCLALLRDAQAMPYGDARQRALASARSEMEVARNAISASVAHSATLRPATEEERRHEKKCNEAIAKLDAWIHQLTPTAEA